MLRRMVIPALLTAGLFTAFGAAPAFAAEAPNPGEVAGDLKSEHIFVDPQSDTLNESQVDVVKGQIDKAETPIYIVVVPDGTFGSRAEAGTYMGDLQQEIGDGTYALAQGNSLAIDSTVLDDSATQKVDAAAKEQSTTTDGLVALVQETDSQASAAESSGVFGMVLLGVLALAVVGGGFFLYNSKKKREAKKAKELAEIKQMATEDVVRLGEDIARLEIDVSAVDDPTRVDYTHAMDSYDRAKVNLDTIQRAEDVKKITTSLEDGRYYMSATRARMEGKEVPERRQPCFFNPQHGPSQQDVMWAPPGGSPRSVTACPACAQAVLSGHDPDVRMVEVDGHRRPYYDAGPAYSPYAGGYYGGDMMMGMFTGMMIGNMMGGGMLGGGMMGGDMGGGGDAGGGDFGGGDFGGGGGFGDMGGGDFGGGDFGGFGDF